MKPDPLAGLTKRQRQMHERHCARYFAKYDPRQHEGWFAKQMRAGRLIVTERYDLDHPARGPNVTSVQCCECGADLQVQRRNAKTPICLACAYRLADVDC